MCACVAGPTSLFFELAGRQARWRDLEGIALTIEGDHALARQVPGWIRLDKAVGRDFPVVRPAA